MNKKIKLLSLVAVTTLLIGCRTNKKDDTPQTQEIDQVMAAFLDGTNYSIPNLPVADDWAYEPLYYYSYSTYYVSAGCTGTKEMETEYANAVTTAGTLVSYNDETYTVEDYGYIFVDDEDDPTVQLSFYYEDDYFNVVVYRNDGKAGTLDVSNVDKSWYVDYVNQYGYIKSTNFPSNQIKLFYELGIDVPSLSSGTNLVYGYYEADEDYVAEFDVYVEGDIVSSAETILKNAGYTVTSSESQTIDWTTYEYVTYTQYTAFDSSHKLVIKFNHQDGNAYTLFNFYQFSDCFTDTKTANADWTSEEKTNQTNYFGEVLPFITLGSDYEFDTSWYSYYSLISFVDTYYESLVDNYGTTLSANGFTLVNDSTSDWDGCYYKDNHTKTLYIDVYYDEGNHIDVYISDTTYVAATAISLDRTTVTAVAGYSFSLTPSLTPTTATSTVTYTSSDESVATVTSAGLVNILAGATEGATTTITAKAEEGVTATCVITVAADAINSISMEATADITLGKNYQLKAEILPLGATGNIAYSVSDNTLASVNETGLVTLTETAKENDTFLITATAGTVTASCTFTVKKQLNYTKVTDNLADFSGEYLIVYGKYAFDGSLETLDASSNYISVTPVNGVIEYTDALHASSFTIAAVTGGYSIQSASGYYIGNENDSNKITTDKTTAKVNTISVTSGAADIVAAGGCHLRFNKTSGQERFRYYKSASYTNQQAIELYKLA